MNSRENGFSLPICKKDLLVPFVFWLLFTPFSSWLDIEVSALFYRGDEFSASSVADWIYFYGLWPAWIVGGASLALFFLSFFPLHRNWRAPALYFLLIFGIGSALCIEGGLKKLWGRPRPRQVVEFGGSLSFSPYYLPHFEQSAYAKSFPSGHASSGFFFFGWVMLGRIYRSSFFRWMGWGGALLLGGALSLSRIAQGGHFLSDTLASATIMWVTAVFVAPRCFRDFTPSVRRIEEKGNSCAYCSPPSSLLPPRN